MDDSHRSELGPTVTRLAEQYGLRLLRGTLGIIFLWFGLLKFSPSGTVIEDLAATTIEMISLGSLSPRQALTILAILESIIGIGLILGRCMRAVLALLFFQMIGTLLPLFLFPDAAFVSPPFVPTTAGQYIIKNLVLISAGIILAATVRGGDIISDPAVVAAARKREGLPVAPHTEELLPPPRPAR